MNKKTSFKNKFQESAKESKLDYKKFQNLKKIEKIKIKIKIQLKIIFIKNIFNRIIIIIIVQNKVI